MVAATALATVMVTHLIDFGADGLRIRLLNANSDGSWSHLLTSGVLVVSSVLMLIALTQSRRQRAVTMLGAAVFVFLSVDEISSLHVQVDSMSWGKLVYAPVLIVLGVCLWRLAGDHAGAVEIRAGLATLIISYGIHVLGPHIVHALGWSSQSWAYEIKVGLKAGTEIAGWLLVLFGLVRLLRDRLPVHGGSVLYRKRDDAQMKRLWTGGRR